MKEITVIRRFQLNLKGVGAVAIGENRRSRQMIGEVE
jgi:hypothetical protein